jgi:hypothetical protein
MNTPADKADIQEERTEAKAETTFADTVRETVDSLKRDAKGKIVWPEEISEELKFAATAEIRFRDTQRSFTEVSKEAKALKAEKSVLLQKATENVTVTLTPEQTEELEDLKFSDPEAWRKKLNQYEGEARTKHLQSIDEDVKKVSASSLDTEERERRKVVLTEFLEANEGFQLDDDVIANDIPPRITNKLKEGKVTFEQFLQECLEYTKKGKVVAQEETTERPNLSKIGGSSSPGKHAVKEDIITSYSKETY